MTSRTIRAGRCLLNASMASSPRLQTATSNDSLFNTSSRPSRMWGSSSTRRILVFISVGMAGWNRQAQGKATAAAVARPIDDFAGVGAGDLAGEREAEAGALNAAAQGIVRAVELFKNLFLAAARDAGAAI